MQPLTPRQMRLVAGPADVCNIGGQSVLREEEAPYAFDSKDARRAQRKRLQSYLSFMKQEGLDGSGASSVPSWQSKIIKGTPERCATADNSTVIDTSFAEGGLRCCAAAPVWLGATASSWRRSGRRPVPLLAGASRRASAAVPLPLCSPPACA